MARVEKDDAREERIDMEVVVDAYGEEERAMGWYTYLGDKLAFPFRARCIAERRSSPLQQGEVVEVTDIAPAEDCEHDMLVDVQWQGRRLAVPLSQLEGIAVDEATQEAIGDWHYWVARGYEFSVKSTLSWIRGRARCHAGAAVCESSVKTSDEDKAWLERTVKCP